MLIKKKIIMERKASKRKIKKPSHKDILTGSETEEEPFGSSSSEEWKMPSPKKTKPTRKAIRKQKPQSNHTIVSESVMNSMENSDKSEFVEHNFDDQLDELLAQSNVEKNGEKSSPPIENVKSSDHEPASFYNDREFYNFFTKIDQKLDNVLSRLTVLESTLIGNLVKSTGMFIKIELLDV